LGIDFVIMGWDLEA